MNFALCLFLLAVQKDYIGAQNYQECATTLVQRATATRAPKEDGVMPESKIVGDSAQSKYAPFQVRLLCFRKFDRKKPEEGGSGCGGAIISKRHILTASHCVGVPNHGYKVDPIDLNNGGAVFVIFGVLNWCPAWEEVKLNPEGPWKNVLLAERIYLHYKYDQPPYKMDHDIAIVKVRHILENHFSP